MSIIAWPKKPKLKIQSQTAHTILPNYLKKKDKRTKVSSITSLTLRLPNPKSKIRRIESWWTKPEWLTQ